MLERLIGLDRRTLRAMRTRWHGPGAERALQGLGTAGEWGAIWIAIGLGGAAVDSPRRRRWINAAASAPVAVGVNFCVKSAARRPRPRLRRLPPLASAPTDLSFPSAHATSSFAAATALGRVSPRSRVPLYALATAISLTRPYLGMHYPSDVLGGAAFGIAIGCLWPGVGAKGTEDRLIDLVVTASVTDRAPATSSANGNSGSGVPPASAGNPAEGV